MGEGMPDFPSIDREYMAWLDVVAEWSNVLPNTMNDPAYDPLMAAIRLWGEELSLLRRTQPADVQLDAYASCIKEYDAKQTAKGTKGRRS